MSPVDARTAPLQTRARLHPLLDAPTRPHARALVEIRNLAARIADARTYGWLGEVEGLRVSLAAAEQKLVSLDRAAGANQRHAAPVAAAPYSTCSPLNNRHYALARLTIAVRGRSVPPNLPR